MSTMWHKKILMCRPDHYAIDYEINDWMDKNEQPDRELALDQWTRLHHMIIRCGGYVEYIEQHKGCPDMVFTANAGVVRNNRFFCSTFKHEERQAEEHYWADWFLENGFDVCKMTKRNRKSGSMNYPYKNLSFEGAGDALEWGDYFICGYGQRSDREAGFVAGKKMGYAEPKIKEYELSSGHFYHLDTCFCPLSPEKALVYSGAFANKSRQLMKEEFGDKLIEVNETEARKFACNAVIIGEHVIMPAGCEETATAVVQHGFKAHLTDMSEFIKSGGACKCLTLELPS